MTGPSGEEIEISAGDQRAVGVEIGGADSAPTLPAVGTLSTVRIGRDEPLGPGSGPDPMAEPSSGR